jgi:hypothetical protein
MYTLTDISRETGINLEALKSRAKRRSYGIVKGHSKIFTQEEKEKLIDPSLYKTGKRKIK